MDVYHAGFHNLVTFLVGASRHFRSWAGQAFSLHQALGTPYLAAAAEVDIPCSELTKIEVPCAASCYAACCLSLFGSQNSMYLITLKGMRIPTLSRRASQTFSRSVYSSSIYTSRSLPSEDANEF